MASQIASQLSVKIDNLTVPTANPPPTGGAGESLKRGRGRPRKDDKDSKAHTSATGQKSYPCDWPHCGMWFSQSSNLNKHYLTHTNEKPFKCLWPNCNKSFKQSSNLNKHRLVHTGEKPFSCDYPQCNKRFSQSSNLKKHKMVHSGEKPYHCQFLGCTKVFDQSSNLNKHILTHMGQKPFSCPECGEKFTQSSNLTKHMRKHGQYNFKYSESNSNRENAASQGFAEEVVVESEAVILRGVNVQQGNCYAENGTTSARDAETSTGASGLPSQLMNVPKLEEASSAAVAMTAAAANAFFLNHNKLINSFDTLDPKFISAITIPSTSFPQPSTSSTSNSPQSHSRPQSSDPFSGGTGSDNGALELANNSPDDPNRFLSMKLSVSNSEE